MKLLAFVCAMLYTVAANAVIYPANPSWSANLTRSPFMAAGAPAGTLACDNTGAIDSGVLNVPSQYIIVCSGDTQVRWSATTDATALSTDFLIPSKTMFFFATGGPDSINRVACYSSGTTCYLIEAK